MRTAIIYNNGPYSIRYALVEGDWSRFQGVYINQGKNVALEDDLCSNIYNDCGESEIKFIKLYEFIQCIRYGVVVIQCGIIK